MIRIFFGSLDFILSHSNDTTRTMNAMKAIAYRIDFCI